MRALLITTLLAVTAASANAATIGSDAGTTSLTISAWDPVGQSFIAAEANLLSIGFRYTRPNDGQPNDPVTLSLYAGEGFGGALLASRTFTLPSDLPISNVGKFIDTDFSGTMLSIGSIYTAALMTSSPRNGVTYGPDGYLGGRLIESSSSTLPGCGSTGEGCDLSFRVIGDAAVPEPASWALLISGFGLAGCALRRRKRALIAA